MVKHEGKINNDKTKKNSGGLVLSIILGVVLVAFIIAVALPDRENPYDTHNGFAFEQRGDFWVTYVELNGIPYEAPFYNHPLDIADIPYEKDLTRYILEVGHTDFVIAVSDNVGATPVLAGANIARVTGGLYGVPTSSALFALPDERDTNQTEFPYVDCSDATQLSPIIWINPRDDVQAIYADETFPHCIVVAGTNDDEILESADFFAYKILEII